MTRRANERQPMTSTEAPVAAAPMRIAQTFGPLKMPAITAWIGCGNDAYPVYEPTEPTT